MKKKIIFINNHFQYSDGTVRAVIGLVNHLDLVKFDITILSLYRCDRRLEAELKDGIKLKKGFGFYFRGFSKIAQLIPVKWLYDWWIKEKYDIEISCQSGLPTIMVGNSPNDSAVHVAWMHGIELWPDCYQQCDKVVCVSKYCADKTKQEVGDKVDVTYKYNLVDDKLICDMARESIEEENTLSPKLISVGRLSPEKGYLRLIKILDELREEGLQFHLTLVGDGPQRKELEAEIKRLKLEDYITMAGAQKNPHKYTAKSDVFICSSYVEGYSTACTEAAILGIPIITTSVPGGEEIISDCECGMLTSIEDEGLKAAVREILLHPELINEWKETMKHTSEKFKLEARKKAINEFFGELYILSDTKINK